MYKFLAGLAIVVLVTCMMAGCRSTKKIRRVVAAPSLHSDTTMAPSTVAQAPVRDLHADSLALIRQTLGQLSSNRVDFQTFSARMKVHYEGGDGKDYELIAFVRIRKDSLIWMSVNAQVGPVNIEAFRMLITRDSVKILDKQKKIARLRSVSYLQEEVHLPVDFQTLQDLLIGNPIFLDTTRILYYKKEQIGLSLFAVGPMFSNYITLNPDNTPRHSKMDDTDPLRVRTCDLTFGDYEQRDGQHFSTYRKISVAEKSKVDIEIGCKQYKFNEALSVSFSVPKNYKRR
jgi:Domain of unknown function (DUF4292)